MDTDREAAQLLERVVGPPDDQYWQRVRECLPLTQRLMLAIAGAEVTLDSWAMWRAGRIPEMQAAGVDRERAIDLLEDWDWYAPADVLRELRLLIDGRDASERFHVALEYCVRALVAPGIHLMVQVTPEDGARTRLRLPQRDRIPFEVICLPLFCVEAARCVKHLWIESRPAEASSEGLVTDEVWRHRGAQVDRDRLAARIVPRFAELLPIALPLSAAIEF